MRITATLFSAILFASCADTKKEEAPVAQVKSASVAIDPIQQRLDALKATPNLDLEALASYLPEKLEGMDRSNFTISSHHGHGTAHADYIRNSKTDMRITVYDVAGEDGSNIYKSYYLTKLDTKDTSAGKPSLMEFNGAQAIKFIEKESGATTVTYMADKQVLVLLGARNLSSEEIMTAARQIKKGSKS